MATLQIKALPASEIRAVLTDLDGTLTSPAAGLTPATYEALSRLHQAGLPVVIVSGCPAGWADALMRLCPALTAVIYENGAGYVCRAKGHPELVELVEGPPREQRRHFLLDRFIELKKEIPHLRLSADFAFRLEDFALDYAQDPPGLSPTEVQKVLAHLRKFPEITAQQSSIHINYWYGRQTKLTACRAVAERLLHLDLNDCVYIGDAPNDEPLFESFRWSVGVANIRPFLTQLRFPPRILTQKPHGEGFLEVVEHLLAR